MRESVRARTRRSARARERRERVMTGDDAGLFCGLKGTRREIILPSERESAQCEGVDNHWAIFVKL